MPTPPIGQNEELCPDIQIGPAQEQIEKEQYKLATKGPKLFNIVEKDHIRAEPATNLHFLLRGKKPVSGVTAEC